SVEQYVRWTHRIVYSHIGDLEDLSGKRWPYRDVPFSGQVVPATGGQHVDHVISFIEWYPQHAVDQRCQLVSGYERWRPIDNPACPYRRVGNDRGFHITEAGWLETQRP